MNNMIQYRYTSEFLREMQALPLARKVGITAARLTEFYEHYEGKVFVSFSGGKDSTVLLKLARSLFPDIKAVFVNTGLEYPEIVDFVKTFDNVDIIRPAKSFRQVIEEEGYPVGSKEISQYIREYRRAMETGKWSTHANMLRAEVCPDEKSRMHWEMCQRYKWLLDAPFKISDKCCDIMKKNTSHQYTKETGLMPIIGTLASESMLRRQAWLRNGCNAFNSKYPKSTPMAFWKEQDILEYIHQMKIQISPIYGDVVQDKKGKWITTGAKRTGCMYCLFGIQFDKEPNRIQQLAQTHPQMYSYILDKLGFREVMDFMKIPYQPVSEPQEPQAS